MWWVNPTTQDTTSLTFSRFDGRKILSPKPLLELTQIVKHKKNITDTFCWILGRVVPDRFTPVFLESVFRETKKRKNISTLKQLPKNYLVFWRNQKNYTNDLLKKQGRFYQNCIRTRGTKHTEKIFHSHCFLFYYFLFTKSNWFYLNWF